MGNQVTTVPLFRAPINLPSGMRLEVAVDMAAFFALVPQVWTKDEHNRIIAKPSYVLQGKKLIVYFGKGTCPKLQQVSQELQSFYLQKHLQLGFEVIYVSGDMDDHQFAAYFGSMPWYALPIDPSRRTAYALEQNFRV